MRTRFYYYQNETYNIIPCWYGTGIVLVISENDNVVFLVTKVV